MSTHNICFHGEIRKKYLFATLSYLEVCTAMTDEGDELQTIHSA